MSSTVHVNYVFTDYVNHHLFFIANRLFPMKREKDWLMRMDMIKKTVIITQELVDNEVD